MKVDVYWNLRKKLFSVRARGKVIGYRTRLIILHPEFIVSEAGRQRVLREKQKNIHAFVRGEMVEGYDLIETFKMLNLEKLKSVTYNPYVHTTFVDQLTRQPVYNADTAVMIEDLKKPMVLVM